MSLLNAESELEMEDMRERRDREISLGTSTVLGIFFALALVCSGFFGFGYSLGRKSAQPVALTASDGTVDSFKSFKPAPGAPAGQSGAPGMDRAGLPASGTGSYAGSGSTPGEVSANGSKPPARTVVNTTPAAASSLEADLAGTSAARVKPVPVAAAVPVAAHMPATAVPGGTGTALVQVSAFRREEDADMVASALRHKGYTVFIRTEPQDTYLHVQLGPYASKKEAEAMRDRLSADGFNAMVK